MTDKPERSGSLFGVDAAGTLPWSADAKTQPFTRDMFDRTLEAMFAYELAGSEEGARELLRSTQPPEDKAFFQELPAHTVELTLLPIPYRNLIFTGILPPECEKCGALDCTKNHPEFL